MPSLGQAVARPRDLFPQNGGLTDTMPFRLFHALRQSDLLEFDAVLQTLRVGPLTGLRDDAGRSLQQVADLMGLGDSVRERMFEHAIEDDGSRLIRFLDGDDSSDFSGEAVLADFQESGSGQRASPEAIEQPYVPSADDELAARAVVALSASGNVAHRNLAQDLCCLISQEAFVPSGERMPVRLPDLLDDAGRVVAWGSVMSRESARRYLSQFDGEVPDPGTRVRWGLEQILDSPGFANGDPQRLAVVKAVLEVFSRPGLKKGERCRLACEVAGVASAVHSNDYRLAAAQAAAGNMPQWQRMLGASAPVAPARGPAERSAGLST